MSRKSKKKLTPKEIQAKDKARWRRILKTYGLTKEQWYKIWNDQGQKCYLCQRTEKEIKKSKSRYITVDHCHITGEVRGLLCVNCNGSILPLFEKDKTLALRILQYLIKNNNYGVAPIHYKGK